MTSFVHALNSSIVVDDKTGKTLHFCNASTLCYPASLTKKMTLYLLFDVLKKRKINLKTRFYVSPFAAIQPASKLGIKEGSIITVDSCIKALIVKSANDVAVVVAEGLAKNVLNFVALMNKKARELKMTSTAFYNPSGLPDLRQFTTASDMVILARSLFKHFPQYRHYFKTTSFYHDKHRYKTHNHLLLLRRNIDGIKTGYTKSSGYNISTTAVSYDKNKVPHRLFVVVMGEKTSKKRDIKALSLIQKNSLSQNVKQPLFINNKKKHDQNTDRKLLRNNLLNLLLRKNNTAFSSNVKTVLSSNETKRRRENPPTRVQRKRNTRLNLNGKRSKFYPISKSFKVKRKNLSLNKNKVVV
ncbi:MAG: D-alanyl-D-alanine carboxypeptidase family protein [Alphaproteobacteria bacterium]